MTGQHVWKATPNNRIDMARVCLTPDHVVDVKCFGVVVSDLPEIRFESVTYPPPQDSEEWAVEVEQGLKVTVLKH